MILNINKSDSVGILSSSLCVIHCIATPFLFVAQTHIIRCCNTRPLWWSGLDMLFIIISAIAIYKSTTNVSKKWLPIVLWISWFLLLVVILNERLGWFKLIEAAIYVPSISLIFFHWYSSTFCKCKNETCCVKHKNNE